MQFVKVLARGVVIGFTIVSLLLVAAVGVTASSGKAGTDNLKSSVVSLFSGHSDQRTAAKKDDGGGGGGDKCKPAQKHHTHATDDQDNDECRGGGGGRDSGSD